jgi:endonuclease-3
MINMTRQERYTHILNYFVTHQPIAETELHYENPYQLLVAVILQRSVQISGSIW